MNKLSYRKNDIPVRLLGLIIAFGWGYIGYWYIHLNDDEERSCTGVCKSAQYLVLFFASILFFIPSFLLAGASLAPQPTK